MKSIYTAWVGFTLISLSYGDPTLPPPRAQITTDFQIYLEASLATNVNPNHTARLNQVLAQIPKADAFTKNPAELEKRQKTETEKFVSKELEKSNEGIKAIHLLIYSSVRRQPSEIEHMMLSPEEKVTQAKWKERLDLEIAAIKARGMSNLERVTFPSEKGAPSTQRNSVKGLDWDAMIRTLGQDQMAARKGDTLTFNPGLTQYIQESGILASVQKEMDAASASARAQNIKELVHAAQDMASKYGRQLPEDPTDSELTELQSLVQSDRTALIRVRWISSHGSAGTELGGSRDNIRHSQPAQ